MKNSTGLGGLLHERALLIRHRKVGLLPTRFIKLIDEKLEKNFKILSRYKGEW